MLLSPDIMRTLLLICMVGMAFLAAFFLRRRGLSPSDYLRWGILIILVPLLGPFLAIAYNIEKKRS